ncbi:MAG: hypothetical protein IMY76_06120, partial [Chloroflexi bacterium]|nr:hypothetical protein [Chloroflexota bacterium]
CIRDRVTPGGRGNGGRCGADHDPHVPASAQDGQGQRSGVDAWPLGEPGDAGTGAAGADLDGGGVAGVAGLVRNSAIMKWSFSGRIGEQVTNSLAR